MFRLWFFIRAKRNENGKNTKGQKTVVKKNGTDSKRLYKVAWGLYLLEIEFFNLFSQVVYMLASGLRMEFKSLKKNPSVQFLFIFFPQTLKIF